MKTLSSVAFLCVILARAGNAQFAFQNLGFESAQLTPVPADQYGDRVSMDLALPGWVGYTGSRQATFALQNNFNQGSPGISILGPNWTTNNGIIAGRYTVVLQTGGIQGQFVSTQISQTGLVPQGSSSIRLKAWGTDFSVLFAGQNIPLVELSTGPNFTLYGGDISSFAGQSGELTLSALSVAPNHLFNDVYFDSIGFSPIAVPEPGVVSLLGAAILILMTRGSRVPPLKQTAVPETTR